MKKLLFTILAITFIIASCSKESKLNRKLDGSWDATTINGSAMPSGSSMSMTFAKDKKGKGTYTSTSTFPAPVGTSTDAGTYTLVDDVTIYSTSSAAGSTQDTATVTSYSKTDLTLSFGKNPATVVVYKKK